MTSREEPPTESENRAAGRSEAQPAGPRGRTPLFARVVAWLVVPVYVAGMSAIILLERASRLQDRISAEDAVLFLGFGMFAVVGALLVAKRPANLIGWIMSAAALVVGIFPAGETYSAYVMTTRGRPDALASSASGPTPGTGPCSSRLSSYTCPSSSPTAACLPAAGSRSPCSRGSGSPA